MSIPPQRIDNIKTISNSEKRTSLSSLSDRPSPSKNTRFAKELLGKYNDTTIENQPVQVVPIYKEGVWFPVNLIEVIQQIISTKCKKMNKTNFRFDFSKEAATHNWNTLSQYQNLGEAIEDNNSSQLSYGSEFREVSVLEPLFQNHPLWNRLKSQLTEGIIYPSEEIDPALKHQDLLDGIEFGNHKGLSKNQSFFEEAMKDEVSFGWQLPIPRNKISQIKGACVAPMNVTDQKSINERGEIIDKKRLTHDQGFKFSSGTSVNSRVKEEELQDVMYGHCLLRIIHTIVAFRLKHPNRRIFISKGDYKAAYRRGHLHWSVAIQTITQCIKKRSWLHSTTNDFWWFTKSKFLG